MKKTLLFVGLAILTLASCKKKGCMDSNAFNYDVTVEKDDGSCNYHATGVLYYTQDTYLNNLVTPPINTLEYYVDGNLIGTALSDNCWVAVSDPIPGKGSPGFMHIDVDMGAQLQKYHTYEVRDAADSETVLFSGNLTFVGGTYHAIELTP